MVRLLVLRKGERPRAAAVAPGTAAERCAPVTVLPAQRVRSIAMGKALILWLLGVPGVIVILLLVTHIL
jgi:hypothetical protein